MAITRQVGKNKSLPVGGSAAADSGDVPSPSGIDHVHAFWGKWIEVPLLWGWASHPSGGYPLFISRCGNMVWLRGQLSWKGSTFATLTVPSPIAVARLPEAVRPDREIRIGRILIKPDGYIYSLTASATYDSAFDTVSTFSADDLIYRTFL